MKQLYYKILYLCLFLLSVGNITAQTTCTTDFTVKTSQIASTCQANGSITVTLEGDIANLKNIQYGLTTSSGDLIIMPQENNVLSNIGAGTYTLTVRAFCAINNDFDVVKTVSNVVVGGTYQVPVASFDASLSRKPYSTCNTGIIVLNVTNGSGNFTFNIISAPAGVTLGAVTPIKGGTTQKPTYTLPGSDYPGGDYVISIEDGCYTASCSFSLEEITGFPTVNSSYINFTPPNPNTTCNTLMYTPGSITTATPDYYRYYTDGLYEVGIAPISTMPTTWVPWSSSTQLFELPSSYKNYISTGTLTFSVYVRVKGCDNTYTSSSSYLARPYSRLSTLTKTCDNFTYTFDPWRDRDGFYCYPISIVVTQTSATADKPAGSIVFNESNIAYGVTKQITFNYDASHTITITDASGYIDTYTQSQTSGSTRINRGLVFTYTDDACTGQYRATYSSNDPCYPIDVTITDPDGVVVHTNTLISSSTTGNYYVIPYDKAYGVKAVYRGTNPERTHNYTLNRASTLPTAYTLTLSSSNTCTEDTGYLQINSGSSSRNYPIGTTITVTGPEGYTTQTIVRTASSYYYYMPTTYLPAGIYTATILHCPTSTPITALLDHKGVYSGRNLGFSTQETCDGLKVIPSGSATYKSVATTTYYRLTSGPMNGTTPDYDQTVRMPGDSFTLRKDGTYTLGILLTNDATGCVLNTLTIEYQKPKFELDLSGSGGYECVDSSLGVILMKAQNGVYPYTFELWNNANTAKIDIPSVVSTTGEQVHFNYGKAGETYMVYCVDACGNSFSQPVSLTDLRTPRIVYANPSNICTGDTIKLKCLTLGNTQYNWTGPNGFTATTQNPEIPNAQTNMSGVYKVSVTPEFCGSPVEDQVEIVVYAPLTAGAVTADQKVCVRTVPGALSCAVTGGSNIYTYQWQSSTDGISGWANIPGAANTVLYTPPSQVTTGVYYYRVIVTDICGSVTSNTMTVNFTPCFIPVNPNIRVRVGKQ